MMAAEVIDTSTTMSFTSICFGRCFH